MVEVYANLLLWSPRKKSRLVKKGTVHDKSHR